MTLSDIPVEDILAIIRMFRQDNPIIRSKALISGGYKQEIIRKEEED